MIPNAESAAKNVIAAHNHGTVGDVSRALAEYRDALMATAQEREHHHTKMIEAYRRAAEETVGWVQAIQGHIADRNYGMAENGCENLLAQLPHDFGAQTFHPMLDRHFDDGQA